MRGSGEAKPLGELLPVVYDDLKLRKPAGVDLAAPFGLDYTAAGIDFWTFSTFNIQYQISEGDGAKALKDFLKTEISACPSEQIVLAGWSQGSHVIADVLSNGAKGTDRITDDELTHIAAVMLFADPRFNSQESFGLGSYELGRNGFLGARTPGDLDRLGAKIRSFCRKEDPVCQSGTKKSLHKPLEYASMYAEQAAILIARSSAG